MPLVPGEYGEEFSFGASSGRIVPTEMGMRLQSLPGKSEPRTLRALVHDLARDDEKFSSTWGEPSTAGMSSIELLDGGPGRYWAA